MNEPPSAAQLPNGGGGCRESYADINTYTKLQLLLGESFSAILI